jgi:hypothetical protein
MNPYGDISGQSSANFSSLAGITQKTDDLTNMSTQAAVDNSSPNAGNVTVNQNSNQSSSKDDSKDKSKDMQDTWNNDFYKYWADPGM